LDANPERARERNVLLDVERLGREAVEELHRAVGLLRSRTHTPTPHLNELLLATHRVDTLIPCVGTKLHQDDPAQFAARGTD
jgi:hypothetical protein